MAKRAQSHRDLDVYKTTVELAMTVFHLSKSFPKEETYSLTDQIRRSSRSVAANIAEAWRKRRYEGSFVSRLSDSEAEVAETQVWLEFAVKCGYLKASDTRELYRAYERVIKTIVGMIHHIDTWLFPPRAI